MQGSFPEPQRQSSELDMGPLGQEAWEGKRGPMSLCPVSPLQRAGGAQPCLTAGLMTRVLRQVLQT